jgi:hypothetical protein
MKPRPAPVDGCDGGNLLSLTCLFSRTTTTLRDRHDVILNAPHVQIAPICAPSVGHFSTRGTRMFLPSQDWSVDRKDLEHLVPSYSSRLMFLEEPRSSLAMSTTMTMMFPTIILENSAFVRSIRCSSNVSIAIQVSNAEAFGKIRQRPGNDLVLVTNKLSCNPVNERGVFLTHETNFDLDTSVVG